MGASMRLLLAVVLSIVHAQSPEGHAGSDDCPCVDPLASRTFNSTGCQGLLRTDDGGTCYPTTYGTRGCRRYDASAATGGTGVTSECDRLNPAPWCGLTWCYVDPQNCTRPRDNSQFFSTGSGLSFSYETCGNVNSFSLNDYCGNVNDHGSHSALSPMSYLPCGRERVQCPEHTDGPALCVLQANDFSCARGQLRTQAFAGKHLRVSFPGDNPSGYRRRVLVAPSSPPQPLFLPSPPLHLLHRRCHHRCLAHSHVSSPHPMHRRCHPVLTGTRS
jgi:hypothetical protein